MQDYLGSFIGNSRYDRIYKWVGTVHVNILRIAFRIDFFEPLGIRERHVLAHKREVDRHSIHLYTVYAVLMVSVVLRVAHHNIVISSHAFGKIFCHSLYAAKVGIVVFRDM